MKKNTNLLYYLSQYQINLEPFGKLILILETGKTILCFPCNHNGCWENFDFWEFPETLRHFKMAAFQSSFFDKYFYINNKNAPGIK